MKAIYFFLASSLLFASCKKDSENAFTKVVTPTFPVVTLKGPGGLTLPIGSTYTDQGATSFDSLNNSTTDLMPVSNNIDPTKAGLYTVNFLAKNLYGYRTSAARQVLISNISAADDISGTYKRSNGTIVHIAKVSAGLYTTDNVGGVANDPTFVFPFYIGFTDLNSFQGPQQSTPIGNVSIEKTEIIRSGTDITLKYVVINANFGTSVRTFTRQ